MWKPHCGNHDFSPLSNSIYLIVQVNLFQKHLFLHQLTHNMTTDCSLNYEFSTGNSKLRTCWEHVVYINCSERQNKNKKPICVHNIFSTCSEFGIFMYWTRNWMNNLLSYCGLVDKRISASEKDLSVIINKTHHVVEIAQKRTQLPKWKYGITIYKVCNLQPRLWSSTMTGSR
jgi:hypothetical protein